MLAPEYRKGSHSFMLRPSHKELMHAIESKDKICHDVHMDPKDINLQPYRTDTEESETPYVYRAQAKLDLDFIQPAMTQLLGRLGMSVKQYNRSPYWLKAKNFNYFNKKYGETLKFRMRHTDEVRAVLSSTYGIIDDIVAIPTIFKGLEDRDDVAIRAFRYDDYITQLFLELTSASATHNNRNYVAGLMVTNSETGHSSVWIEPVVFTSRYVWVNRRVLSKQKVDCRIIHRGKIDPKRVRSMVEKNAEVAQVGIIQLEEAHHDHIDAKKVLSYIKNSNELPNRWEALMAEHLGEAETIARAEAAREILRLAESLPLFQRAQAEQAAGAFIGLFDHFEERMLSIIEDMS